MKAIVLRWGIYYLQYSPIWKQLVKIRKQEDFLTFLFQGKRQKTIFQEKKYEQLDISGYQLLIKTNNRLKMMTHPHLNYFNQNIIKKINQRDLQEEDFSYKAKYKIMSQLIKFLDLNINNKKNNVTSTFVLDNFFQMIKTNDPLDLSQRQITNIQNQEQKQKQIQNQYQLSLRREVLCLDNQFCKRVLLSRFKSKKSKEFNFQNQLKNSQISYFCKFVTTFISQIQQIQKNQTIIQTEQLAQTQNSMKIQIQGQEQIKSKTKTFQQRVSTNKIKLNEENFRDWILAIQENINSICIFVINKFPSQENLKMYQSKEGFQLVLSFYENVIKLMRSQSIKQQFKRQYVKMLNLFEFSQEKLQLYRYFTQLTQNQDIKSQKIVEKMLYKLIFDSQNISQNNQLTKRHQKKRRIQQPKFTNYYWIIKLLQKKLQSSKKHQQQEKNELLALLKKTQTIPLSYCQNIVFNQLLIRTQKFIQSQQENNNSYEIIRKIRSIKSNLKQDILQKGQKIIKNMQEMTFQQSLSIMKQMSLYHLKLTQGMFHTQNFKKIFLKMLNLNFCNKFCILIIKEPQILYLILESCINLEVSSQQFSFSNAKKKLKLQNRISILSILQYKNMTIDCQKHQQIFKGWVKNQSRDGYIWSQQAQNFCKACQKLFTE